MTEFSDRPMKVPSDAKLIYNLPEARHVTDYLEDYCDNHSWDGTTLRERIVFDCDVKNIRKAGPFWRIHTSIAQKKTIFSAPKLVMASGLYTEPSMPDLPGLEKFRARSSTRRTSVDLESWITQTSRALSF